MLGAIFGGRSTATTRAGSAARSAGRVFSERGDVARAGESLESLGRRTRRAAEAHRAGGRRAHREPRPGERRAREDPHRAAQVRHRGRPHRPRLGTLARRRRRLPAPGLDVVRPRNRARCSRPASCCRLLACAPAPGPMRRRSACIAPWSSTDGGDLPFGLELVREDGGLVAYLVNGPERVRATGVRLEDGNLSIQMPGYQNRIEATFKDGRFEGTLYILRPRGIVRELRLVAMPGEAWRFFPKPDAAPLDFSGRWALTFRDADGGESAGDRGARPGRPRGDGHGAAPERRRPLHRRRGARRHAVPVALRRRHGVPLPRAPRQRRRARRRAVHRRRLPGVVQRPPRPGGEARQPGRAHGPQARRRPARVQLPGRRRQPAAAIPTPAMRARSCWSRSAAAGARTATTRRPS